MRTDAVEARECHCTQCRRQSGHVWAFLTVPWDAVEWSVAPAIYQHSDKADRGFCAECGSYVYWRERDAGTVDLSAGLFDQPTGLHLGPPSFTGNKGDYYQVSPWTPSE
ncbi:hypothetical protein GCM10007893_16720 [Paracoccus marinus]|nr:hypothetical protein GCM10007893_16720 [Paracoccus marinus]